MKIYNFAIFAANVKPLSFIERCLIMIYNGNKGHTGPEETTYTNWNFGNI